MPEIGQNIVKHKIRYDLEIISSLIRPKAKVLDIGCGDGELLQFLLREKNIDGRGLEISQTQVSKALMRGLSVIQGNAENDLTIYPDRSFDYAVLSQTIQATHRPKDILHEMLRVAEFAIVSLPNFAHFKNRLHLLFKGAMPVNKMIPYEWYETPNIHFCSIKDFEKLCKDEDFQVDQKIFLTARRLLFSFLGHHAIANFFAEYGIFLITKKGFSQNLQEEFAFKKASNLASSASPSMAFSKKVR
ncbi:MAG: methionine biosynthesis protein MetW [Proteobacteria bacterium]|nr:methionine biosynthesis protein MetW [Pseudomonadota bacterium]